MSLTEYRRKRQFARTAEPEPGKPGRRVQRAAAAVERHLVHEGYRSVRQLVDGSRDHVGDEDAEADDVDHYAIAISMSSATPPRIV